MASAHASRISHNQRAMMIQRCSLGQVYRRTTQAVAARPSCAARQLRITAVRPSADCVHLPSIAHADAKRAAVSCAAKKGPSEAEAVPSSEPSGGISPISIGIGLLWAFLGYYAFFLSPNQTPYRDQIFIQLLVGLTQDETFKVNQVYFSVFNIIGVYTFVYQSLLIPGARSANKIPVWPFVLLSYAAGAFALLPFMALWSPIKGYKLPLPKEELSLPMQGGETVVVPAIALAASCYLLYNAFSADSSVWLDYLRLFDESRLVNISSIDCTILATLAPFWMSNDAELRDWKDREKLLPILSFIPVLGPVTYLLLRPKSGEEQQ